MSFESEFSDMMDAILDAEEFGIVLTFGNKTAFCALDSITESLETEPSGYLDMLDSHCTMRLADFKRLGIKMQDEIQVEGKTLRVVTMTTRSPIVTLGLKASR